MPCLSYWVNWNTDALFVRCDSLIIIYHNLLRWFRICCDVNPASCSSRLFEAIEEAQTGIRCRCRGDKTPPPPSEKRGTVLAATPYGEMSQFLLLYISCSALQVKPFVAYTTCDLGSCVAAQTLWLPYICECCLTSFCHSHFFPVSLSTSEAYFLPHRLIIRHQALVVMAKLHLNLLYFPHVFQPAAVSHINSRCAPRQTKLNWSTL